jgi:hypothetical protein
VSSTRSRLDTPMVVKRVICNVYQIIARFQVLYAKQWLTAGDTQLIPFGRVSSRAQLGRCL